ncbi:hypothetical protein [Polaromonas sp. YR568]|uniref:hypothetical protein n=1 Tax=Polaromonas sp. YR568 TaxID=1855301 RepID=UPI0031381AD4
MPVPIAFNQVMKHHSLTTRAQPVPPTHLLRAHTGGLLLLAAVAWLAANLAHAQAPAEPAATAATTPTVAATSTPRYSTQDIERAFSFMDKNRDRKVSRDEASNFRGVSKYFDRADTDKDSHLSPEEFKQALNKS